VSRPGRKTGFLGSCIAVQWWEELSEAASPFARNIPASNAISPELERLAVGATAELLNIHERIDFAGHWRAHCHDDQRMPWPLL
jgi:hypothetical protein